MPRPKQRTPELRADLLRGAVGVLERDGTSGFGVRPVAAAAGTSVAALYELYGDKAGLVQAMFLDGFRQLHQQLTACPVTEEERADLIALLRTSRLFAVQRPMRFEVMFACPFAEFAPGPEDRWAARGVYDLIVDAVRRWLSIAHSGTDPVDAAHALVSANRGLIASELAGMLGSSPNSVERRWALTVSALLDGLLHQS